MQPGIATPDDEEQQKHLSAIQSLSEQYHLPADTVAKLYQGELSRFREGALVTNYLSIFVSRRVNEMLRSLKSSTPSGPAADSSVQ